MLKADYLAARLRQRGIGKSWRLMSLELTANRLTIGIVYLKLRLPRGAATPTIEIFGNCSALSP